MCCQHSWVRYDIFLPDKCSNSIAFIRAAAAAFAAGAAAANVKEKRFFLLKEEECVPPTCQSQFTAYQYWIPIQSKTIHCKPNQIKTNQTQTNEDHTNLIRSNPNKCKPNQSKKDQKIQRKPICAINFTFSFTLSVEVCLEILTRNAFNPKMPVINTNLLFMVTTKCSALNPSFYEKHK